MERKDLNMEFDHHADDQFTNAPDGGADRKRRIDDLEVETFPRWPEDHHLLMQSEEREEDDRHWNSVRSEARLRKSRRRENRESAKRVARRLAGGRTTATAQQQQQQQGPQDLAQVQPQPRLTMVEPGVVVGSSAATTFSKTILGRDVHHLVRPNRVRPPSLQELCTDVIAEYANHVVSLEGVPSIHRACISRGLCSRGRMTAEVLSLFFADCPCDIDVYDCSFITESQLIGILGGFSTANLQVLHLGFLGASLTKRSLSVLAAHHCPKLESLSLSGAWKLAYGCLAELLSVSPKLKCLDLSQCSGLTDIAVKSVSDLAGTTLESLILDDCKILDAGACLPSIVSLKKLTKLSLAGVGGVTDEVVEQISIHLGPNLKELILANCCSLHDKAMAAIGSSCPTLELLNLEDNIALTDVGLGSIMNGCGELKVLVLTRCGFSDEAVAAFINNSGDMLQRLNLNSLREVTDRVLYALAQHSNKSLEQLDASWCRQLSDEGLNTLVNFCSKLCSLKLFGCTQVTQSFIKGYSNSSSRSLKVYA